LFSYRHGFHAGNHADVLKHIVLLATLDHYREKPSGFWFIDTHAGAGLYDLQGAWANKNSEYLGGIERVRSTTHRPALVDRYVQTVQALNAQTDQHLYPGSPWIALQDFRAQDKLKLFELLGAETEVLSRNLGQITSAPRAIQVLHQDGFVGLKALLPPATRRAVVLIDPSYENKQDYRQVVRTIKEALIRFASGSYLIWYPRVNRLEPQQMIRHLRQLPEVQWLDIELTVSKPPTDSMGLFGSGMFLINPPYTLEASLKEVMPWLVRTLGLDSTARWQITSSAQPKQPHGHPHGQTPHRSLGLPQPKRRPIRPQKRSPAAK
jgi:23S rRNA (adenine2030-N6)-methyltransferase